MAFAQLDAPRAARSLLTLSAISERCEAMLAHGLAGRIKGVVVRQDQLTPFAGNIDAALPENKYAAPDEPAAAGEAAHDIFAAVLPQAIERHGGAIVLGGVALGDTAMHVLMRRGDSSDGLVPFHAMALRETAAIIAARLAAGRAVAGAGRLPCPACPALIRLFQHHDILQLGADADSIAAKAIAVALGLRLQPLLPARLAPWPLWRLLVAGGFVQEIEDV